MTSFVSLNDSNKSSESDRALRHDLVTLLLKYTDIMMFKAWFMTLETV